MLVLVLLVFLCLMPSLLYSASKKKTKSTPKTPKTTTKKPFQKCNRNCEKPQAGGRGCMPIEEKKNDPECKKARDPEKKKNSADSMISCLKIILFGLFSIMTIS